MKIKVEVTYTIKQKVWVEVDNEDEIEDILREEASDNLVNYDFAVKDIDYDEIERLSKEEETFDYYEEDYRQEGC